VLIGAKSVTRFYCGNNPVNWIDPWGLCSKEPLFDEHGKINPNRVGDDGIVDITDDDLRREIERYRNSPNYPKKTGDLMSADTYFHTNRQYRYRYQGKVYGSSEVNYIGVGDATHSLHWPWIIAKDFPKWHNNGLPWPLKKLYPGYGHPTTKGEEYYYYYGYWGGNQPSSPE